MFATAAQGAREALRRTAAFARSGAGSRLAFVFIVYMAAVPFAGVRLPSFWFAIMAALIAGRTLRTTGPHEADPFDWLLSVGYSVAAFYSVFYFEGALQTFAVTLYGVVMFQILARDHEHPRRLVANLAPPVVSLVIVQFGAAWLRIRGHREVEIVTLLASPLLVFLVFRATQANLTQSRAREREALAQARDHARRTAEAHRVAILAEDMAGMGHWRLDTRSRAFSCSAGINRIFGLDRAKGVPGMGDLLSMFVAEDRAQVRARVDATVRDGAPFAFEARLQRPNGETRVVIARGAAQRSPAGEITTVVGATMDITAVRRREEALVASEARFRMLADHATDIVLWGRQDGAILYASPAVRQLGYEPDGLIGRNMIDLAHPDDRARAAGNLAGLFSGAPVDASVRREYRVRKSDGGYVWLEGNPTIIRDQAGRPISVVTSLRDVTRRRALEDDMLAAKLAAEAGASAKSEFLANMSHEIRTPLTGILGFSALLQAMDDLPPAAVGHVRRIVTGGRTLLSVVNDILDFSKLEAGQVRLDPQPFAPEALLADVIESFAPEALAKGIRLAVDLDTALPAWVLADAARLRQVLVNLVGNAIKFTEGGAVTLTAEYETDGGGRLAVIVSDTGVGVPADKLDRLFERFSQVDGSVSRRFGGTGLGLSICRRLVELMGGEIGVVSAEGVGSTFEFFIPAPPAASGQTDGGAEAPRVLAGQAPPASILVVDDLDVNRELVRAILEAVGQEVTEAASGVEAVGAAMKRPFDLILMDLQMPQVDGFAAARAIRVMAPVNRGTPIVALSANVLPEHVKACAKAGMNDHVGKPIVPADLIAAVSRWAGVRIEEAGVEGKADGADHRAA